jgi:hypothetical protein
MVETDGNRTLLGINGIDPQCGLLLTHPSQRNRKKQIPTRQVTVKLLSMFRQKQLDDPLLPIEAAGFKECRDYLSRTEALRFKLLYTKQEVRT